MLQKDTIVYYITTSTILHFVTHISSYILKILNMFVLQLINKLVISPFQH